MNKQKWIFFAVVLLMMGSTAAVLAHLKANQKLGRPGVTTRPLADSKNVEVLLPERVLDYTSEKYEQEKIVVDSLPKDTSYGQRRYKAPDGFWVQANVVLMGSDRTSIHKPQFCLEGGGWRIDQLASGDKVVPVERPHPYDLPVKELLSTKQIESNGKVLTARGIYVYWFVAEDAYTAQHWQRQWWMARELLQTGVLQRWAYISYFAVCMPGQEQETFERMKKLIAASVPEFQLVPDPKEQAAPAAQRPM
jgi:Protein of unknown function (DUF3485)